MEEILEEMDVDQFVNQEIPADPEKVKLSLIFSKDLIGTLQQDIQDLHHRLKIADAENNDNEYNTFGADDDERAGIHETNPTLLRMDQPIGAGSSDGDDNDNYNPYARINKQKTANLYDMNSDSDDQKREEEEEEEEERENALNKKKSGHDRFFSTYNILSKQINTKNSLIQSMGTFEALLTFSDNAVTFKEIIANLTQKLKNSKSSFNMIRDALNELELIDVKNTNKQSDTLHNDYSLSDDDDDTGERTIFLQSAKEIVTESKNIVGFIDEVIDELHGAQHLIHPDHKKIHSLQSRIKELQVTLPLHKIKKLAILNELPKFIRQELSDSKIQKQTAEAREKQRLHELRGHKKKRTKTLVQDDIPIHEINNNHGLGGFHPDQLNQAEHDDEEEKFQKAEEERIDNFKQTMDATEQCIATIQQKLEVMESDIITDGLNDGLLDLMDDDDQNKALLNGYIEQLKDEVKSLQDSTNNIVTYFHKSKEYVHPTQNVLITAVSQYIESQVENEKLANQIDLLHAELDSKDDEIALLKKEKLLNNDDKKKYDEYDSNHDIDSLNTSTEEFVGKIISQLTKLRDKSDTIHSFVKQDGDDLTSSNKTSLSSSSINEIDSEVELLSEMLDDLNISLKQDHNSFLNLTPLKEYIMKIESRYEMIKKLYRLKFTEIEKTKDLIIYNESQLELKNAEIEELETRLIRIMTSATSSADTRLEALNSMEKKSQTYRSVMDLIDDNLRTTSSALLGVEKICRNKDINNDNKDIVNYCKTIKKGLIAVQEEMHGARNFVHPDRDLVYALQEQIMEMKENGVKQSDGVGINGIMNMDDDYKNNEDNEDNDNDIDDIDEHKHHNDHVQFKKRDSNHFKSKTHSHGSAGVGSSGRRTKSVHEIAWSQFNAKHETEMEDLEKEERQVVEDQIREKIIEEIQEKYDDKFDRETSNLRVKIREEIRREYEDIENKYIQQQQFIKEQDDNDDDGNIADNEEEQEQEEEPFDVDKLKSELEEEYDRRLEVEKEKIENHFAESRSSLQNEISDSKSENSNLQQEMNKMQDAISKLKNQINQFDNKQNEYEIQMKYIEESKIKLIKSTADEIDHLRSKIKEYTNGNWDGVIQKRK